jgi:hypothetical protein
LKLSKELDIKVPVFVVDKKSKFFHQSIIQKQKTESLIKNPKIDLMVEEKPKEKDFLF